MHTNMLTGSYLWLLKFQVISFFVIIIFSPPDFCFSILDMYVLAN